MAPGFEVDERELAAHVKQVEGFAADADLAADAADEVKNITTVGNYDVAYGLYFQWAAIAVRQDQLAAAQAIRNITNLLEKTRAELERTLVSYVSVDNDLARRFEQIEIGRLSRGGGN